jgi:maltose/moltooligosaccharide transporter
MSAITADAAAPAPNARARARLSFFQIWNMCFGFFGIQIGFGLQNANTSRIFQTLGANIDDLAVLWIAAPLTGLLVQPIIGYMSDRTWGKLGRRRPYFFFGAILTTLALFLMPNAPILWIAAGALWLMDASINITMEPFRAFVGDNLPDEQRTTGYAMQSFFIGLGAVFASALPWMMSNWFAVSNVASPGEIPESVRLAFYIGGVCLLAAVMWTVFTSKEYSPEQLAAFEKARVETLGAEDAAEPAPPKAASFYYVGGVAWALAGAALAAAVARWNFQKELYLLAGFVIAFGAAQLVAGLMKAQKATQNGFFEVIEDLFQMPTTMRGLAIVQFFSWFGLFAMWIYTTAAVTSVHYGATDTASQAYNDGADWVGILFAAYNAVAALAAIVIPLVAAAIGRKLTHTLNLTLGALGLFSFFWIRDPQLLWIPMIGVGFAWASILSVPYSILAGVLPAKKMGVYMGIFNIFIVVPQLLAATVLGLLLNSFFDGQAIYALALGGGSMLLAAGSVLFVRDPAAAARRKAA